jgi:aminoglycoside 6-adenylyltransferase
MNADIFECAIEWAKKQATIRVMFLTSTRAGHGPIDELSDYDVALFTYDSQPFMYDSSWMKEIGEVWVYQKCQFDYKDQAITTRLVVFDGGERIDFSFWNMKMLADFLRNGLPDEFNIGYQVIFDKDGVTKHLPEPTYDGFRESKPTSDFFLKRIHDFWYNVYCMAKYLSRKDLFHVKFIQSDMNQVLLQMIIWNMQSKNSWSLKTHSWGKKMESWVDEDIWRELHDIYSRFDVEDSWRGLFSTMNFYRKIAGESAQKLGYSYPDHVDRHISAFIMGLYEKNMPAGQPCC